jgi:hypothetical protein
MIAQVKLIEVGYWARPADLWRRFPLVDDFIDPAWSPTERAKVIQYLLRGRRHEAYMGMSTCRLCDQDNGCLDLTDGVYVWPDGLVHYVRDHAVKPPQAFVDHVLAATR